MYFIDNGSNTPTVPGLENGQTGEGDNAQVQPVMGTRTYHWSQKRLNLRSEESAQDVIQLNRLHSGDKWNIFDLSELNTSVRRAHVVVGVVLLRLNKDLL